MRRTTSSRRGFTLPEILIASTLLVFISTGVMSFYVMMRKVWLRSTVNMTASIKGTTAMEYIMHGVGGTNIGLREAIADTVSVTNTTSGWQIGFNTNRWFKYDRTNTRLMESSGRILCDNVITSSCAATYEGVTIAFDVVDGTSPYRATNRFYTYVDFRN